MVVLPAGIVGRYNLSILDERVVLSEQVSIIAADVRIEAA
jgi:hypothetical protein